MSDHLKCLMIGAAGIGKSSLLKALPNARLVAPEEHARMVAKETYVLDASHFHGELEKSKIEIQNIDISIETCLSDSDMFLNTAVLSSSQIININNIDVIIFCFALDDVNSFHLIRSKWDIYLKKMTKNSSKKFILIGLKSDLVNDASNSKDGETDSKKKKKDKMDAASIKVMYKKRSCSVNSVSSTSRLHSSKLMKKKKRIISESESSPSAAAAAAACISNNTCKKFAKLIRAKFIKLSNLETTSTEHMASFMDEMSACLKSSSSAVAHSSTMTTLKRTTSTFKSKLPKSISAPISTLVNRRSRKLIDVVDKEANNNENELVKIGEPTPTIENISLKKKLSQLLTGLGTYVVTCGSKHKSRKLINNGGQPLPATAAAPVKSSPLRNHANNLLKRKNKSWLLLGSDASLNSLTNEDEVFA